MKKRSIFLLTLTTLVLISLFLPTLSAQEYDFKTNYQITLNNDTSANWTIENRIKLETDSQENQFQKYLSNITETETNLFKDNIKAIVSTASNSTQRKMSASNFSLNGTIEQGITGTYGVIHYNFHWTNFTVIDNEKIKLGDVFVNGLYLSETDTLTIHYPTGYKIHSIDPEPTKIQDKELIWKGPNDFEPNNPEILLKHEETEKTTSIQKYGIIIALIITLSSATIYIYFNKFKKKNQNKTTKPEDYDNDLELILNILEESNGSIFQTKLVEKTGFSKAKVSNLLKKLKKEEKIKKIKKGRQNLIKLKK
ncbi:MAG: putative membrane-associated trancriptional regulator [Candidatus Methanohalarchaeum thermophilum]|uniref:Membrane-associated trancriptional regulator n=1 Tax=Methanohalarchaeum thermophilum TaxID=1903181 RepID=A0A1Q6DXT9_METT1|nr:MAG: putative membrane-associated trancriptional regulator [Candidatus Methanohalarchaeum thermophilum]